MKIEKVCYMQIQSTLEQILFTAIDPDGLLCQSRDTQSWHGTRSNKAVTGDGKYYPYNRSKLVIKNK